MNQKKGRASQIAYFSMEIALDDKLSTYAGGLGILAGDFLRSAADRNLPLVGVSLLNKRGYLKQRLDRSGRQTVGAEFNRSRNLKKLALTVPVNIGAETVMVGVWRYLIQGRLPVYLLDTDRPENTAADRNLTNRLYGGDHIYRLQQEIILGRGGVKLLQALGYRIRKYHINEGHGILAAIELLAEMPSGSERQKKSALRRQLVFTNHTTVRAGQDVFPLATILSYQPDFPASFPDLITDKKVNLTRLGVALAGRTNGVSANHARILKQEFPRTEISYVTNGVHAAFWSSPEFVKLYDRYLPGWQNRNSRLKKAGIIPLPEIERAHRAAKARLLGRVMKMTGVRLDAGVFTLVFARRFTAYKQPLLLLSNMRRLLEINRRWPIQIIYAGKAHPQDKGGQAMIKKIYRLKEKYRAKIKIVFLADYDIKLARLLTAGADLWLNNPLPPNEACGTSGMKAALNGVPQLSSPDGWWREGYRPGRNGWLIKDSRAPGLYRNLERAILPLYYERPEKWQALMRSTIISDAPIYNSERMVREYWRKIYGL